MGNGRQTHYHINDVIALHVNGSAAFAVRQLGDHHSVCTVREFAWGLYGDLGSLLAIRIGNVSEWCDHSSLKFVRVSEVSLLINNYAKTFCSYENATKFLCKLLANVQEATHGNANKALLLPVDRRL